MEGYDGGYGDCPCDVGGGTESKPEDKDSSWCAGFEAGRLLGLEQAAKIAEEQASKKEREYEYYGEIVSYALRSVAAAINALNITQPAKASH